MASLYQEWIKSPINNQRIIPNFVHLWGRGTSTVMRDTKKCADAIPVCVSVTTLTMVEVSQHYYAALILFFGLLCEIRSAFAANQTGRLHNKSIYKHDCSPRTRNTLVCVYVRVCVYVDFACLCPLSLVYHQLAWKDYVCVCVLRGIRDKYEMLDVIQ